jgi:hypothetical protein
MNTAMAYLTRPLLMSESERTVRQNATIGDVVSKRICSQILDDESHYALWHSRHEGHMRTVAAAKQRERQIRSLRMVAIEQVHRTALVRYLRDNRITGHARDETLREFYGVADPRCSALLEHRSFLVAASTQLCTDEILTLAEDIDGVEMLRRYELAFGQYFSMFCEQARMRRNGTPFLLASLLPEVRRVAERWRLQILRADVVAASRTRIAMQLSAAPYGDRVARSRR